MFKKFGEERSQQTRHAASQIHHANNANNPLPPSLRDTLRTVLLAKSGYAIGKLHFIGFSIY
ncbi:MAG: hypothetical protein RMZ43_009785 [Nostoc sp. CmiVER01]|uniref:hypothetical protein n=1 Tax=Nostoc sp. CmiVER01 TaxID=3075384 RepID=UPI002AD41B1A|nr:hypothetical protein [Nostoc sp. CmiVER01]MDZ8123585.1 hypothetical protein [Nostoc sp. CmiVER01]